LYMQGNRPSPEHVERAVCEEDIEDGEVCEGLAFPRGFQLGEHTYITREAMRVAGFNLNTREGPIVFVTPVYGFQVTLDQGYYTDGATALDTELPSMEPSATGSMLSWLGRRVSLPEISEVADGSH